MRRINIAHIRVAYKSEESVEKMCIEEFAQTRGVEEK